MDEISIYIVIIAQSDVKESNYISNNSPLEVLTMGIFKAVKYQRLMGKIEFLEPKNALKF